MNILAINTSSSCTDTYIVNKIMFPFEHDCYSHVNQTIWQFIIYYNVIVIQAGVRNINNICTSSQNTEIPFNVYNMHSSQ